MNFFFDKKSCRTFQMQKSSFATISIGFHECKLKKCGKAGNECSFWGWGIEWQRQQAQQTSKSNPPKAVNSPDNSLCARSNRLQILITFQYCEFCISHLNGVQGVSWAHDYCARAVFLVSNLIVCKKKKRKMCWEAIEHLRQSVGIL